MYCTMRRWYSTTKELCGGGAEVIFGVHHLKGSRGREPEFSTFSERYYIGDSTSMLALSAAPLQKIASITVAGKAPCRRKTAMGAMPCLRIAT